MVELSLKEIADVTLGKVYGTFNIDNFNAVTKDTRDIQSGDIFVAFKGEKFNANKHVDEAFSKGATLCIVDELHYDINNIPEYRAILLVNNVSLALGFIAKYYIRKLGIKVVGVTGSCGKTSTKDMIAASLSSKYKVLKTLGNYNNHIGLPLTILRLDSSYDVAVLEMGMSNLKEIEYLANIAKPYISVITNIGLSHIENLGTQENILKAKLESATYFEEDNVLIINGDDLMLSTIKDTPYELIKIGEKSDFDFYYKNESLNPLSSTFDVLNKDFKIRCSIDIPGKHNITNFLLSIAIANKFGISVEEAMAGLQNIEKTSMRLDITELSGYIFINDCYNSSPDSIKSAVDVQINLGKKRNIIVLGPMFELGNLSEKCHYEVGTYIANKNIDKVFTTGIYTKEYKRALGDKCLYFDDKESLMLSLKEYIREEDSILIKASRGAHFEDILNSFY